MDTVEDNAIGTPFEEPASGMGIIHQSLNVGLTQGLANDAAGNIASKATEIIDARFQPSADSVNSDPSMLIDAAALFSKRTRARTRFTRKLNKVKKSIWQKESGQLIDQLMADVDNYYERSIDYHNRYCEASGRTDFKWTENLHRDYQTAQLEIDALLRREVAPETATRTRAQIQRAVLNERPNAIALTVAQKEQVVSKIPQPELNVLMHSRTTEALDDVTHQTKRNRSPSSVSSASSLASMSLSYVSQRSSLSDLTRERQAAELELEMTRKRREEEQAENDRLEELARQLQEEKRRIEARRQDRKIEEDIARLRMSETLFKQPLSSLSHLSTRSSIIDYPFTAPLPGTADKGLTRARLVDIDGDNWIEGLEQTPTTLPAVTPTPWMFGGSAPFACKNPFDGDPRDWPLFTSRFKELVQDVIPNDAQRLAILTEWVGPNVLRRITPLLKAPRGYSAALAYLKRHYGSNESIARCQIHDLLNLAAVKPGDRESLEVFADQLHGAVVVLEQGGLQHDLMSAANLDRAVQKLPTAIRYRWARFVRKQSPRCVNLRDLDQFLEEVVEEERLARSINDLTARNEQRDKRVAVDKPAVGRQPHTKFAASKSQPIRPQPTVLATQSSDSGGCPNCGEDHLLATCAEFRQKSPNERVLMAKEKGVCFNCLIGRHRSFECRLKPACGTSGCRGRHHALLHGADRLFPDRNGQQRQQQSNCDQDVSSGPKTFAIAPRLASDVLLAVVPVRLHAGGRTLDVFALLDTGSQATLLREDAAKALGLKGRPHKVRFGTFNGKDPKVETRLVDFTLSSVRQEAIFQVSDAYVVPRLNVGQRKMKDVLASLEYLRDLDFPAREAADVQLLIGMDVQDAHINIEVRRPPVGVHGPNAVLTPFGWCVVGKAVSAPITNTLNVNFVALGAIEQLEGSVERFWKTQSLPVRDAPKTFMSVLDRVAIEQLESTIRHTGTRYEVGLPIRPNSPKLPDNREVVFRKFLALERRLIADDELRRAVTSSMYDVIRHGHAVRVTSTSPGAKVWFLSYHPVRHPSKPDKIRVVYDAAARYKGICVNDVLLKGPDLTTQLLAVLLRFREKRVGVTADIAKMFYQVLVPTLDRSMFRFLWREPGSKAPLQEFEMAVHVFGAVSSPTVCNFALQRLEKDAPNDCKDIAYRIRSDFYVDNFLASFDDADEGVAVSKKLIDLLDLGGFKLVQFLSSSRSLLDQLPNAALLLPELNLDFDDLPVERTLGYLWNCERDEFVFRFKPIEQARSKRSILASISSIYDPLGLLAPIVLVAKIILQDIWRLKCGWDETLPAEILNRWGNFVDHLPLLELISIPRSFLTCPVTAYRSFQLHAFSDASKDGFGTVVYVRTESDVEINVSFVMAKVRVAPIHQLSIPKMELQGALLSVRLVNYLLKELTLPISAVFFWVDAMTVLRWIHASHRRYHVFVANRIAEILDTTTPEQWRHVPGILNPADECSRGLCPSELDQSHRWFRGPKFLKLAPDQWPSQIIPAETSETEEDTIACHLIVDSDGPLDALVARIGNLHRLIRIAAWIERFVSNVRALARRSRVRENAVVNGGQVCSAEENVEPVKTGRLHTVDELKAARFLLVRVSQRYSFPDDLASLRKTKTVRRESRLLKLAVYLDATGVIRVGGRLDNAPISREARHPAVLDPKHPLTKLLIRWAHLSVAHGRADRTLAEVRTRYWVLSGKDAVKSVITSCFYCSRMRARPFQPMMASLPAERVQPFNPPFTSVGVDYLGPFIVSIGRRTEKRWIALFTCLATRAIHLEIAPSMDVDSFLMAFTRFVSRRGTPVDVFSDNGTNFTAGERELREAVYRLNAVKIDDQMARKEINWHFSPPLAPHFGGVWERLVRSCKDALRAILGRQTVKEEVLATVVIEVEALLNNRPLTELGADPQEFEPLTPNHFLIGRPNPHLPADVVEPENKCFRRRWRHAQQIVDHVWSRWLREYLPTLTTRSKWCQPERDLKVNDLVLMVDPKSPRGHWPLCRVTEVMPGPDGVVRTAEIVTKSGRTYVRSVTSLCRLEAFGAA